MKMAGVKPPVMAEAEPGIIVNHNNSTSPKAMAMLRNAQVAMDTSSQFTPQEKQPAKQKHHKVKARSTGKHSSSKTADGESKMKSSAGYTS